MRQMQKHVKVCAKVNAKRKVYSAVAMRVGGTEAAKFVKEQVRENKPPLKPLAKELAISRIDGKTDAADESPTTVL